MLKYRAGTLLVSIGCTAGALRVAERPGRPAPHTTRGGKGLGGVALHRGNLDDHVTLTM